MRVSLRGRYGGRAAIHSKNVGTGQNCGGFWAGYLWCKKKEGGIGAGCRCTITGRGSSVPEVGSAFSTEKSLQSFGEDVGLTLKVAGNTIDAIDEAPR